jgi:hypothetical protein
MAARATPVIGHQAAQQEALCSGLLAAKFADGIKLIDISVQAQCEILTLESVPFVCQGSGKANADPFLRFIWNIYWSRKQPPSLKEAVLAGYWTVRVVTDLRTPGVGCGVEVFTLSIRSGNAVAQQVAESAFEEHDGFIGAVEEAMRGVRDTMLGRSTDAAAEPPEPPKAK